MSERSDLRTLGSDRSILDTLHRALHQALNHGVPEEHHAVLDTMRQAILGAWHIVENATPGKVIEESSAMALAEMVLRGVERRAEFQAGSMIWQDASTGVTEERLRSPRGIAQAAYFTVAATVHAYLLTTEGGH